MKIAVQENLVPGKDATERWARARDWGFDGLELRGAGGIKARYSNEYRIGATHLLLTL